MKHSKALLVALAFCIGALVGALFVQAQTSLSIQYLMGGIYPGAPTYTIWKEGSNYLAKDAHGQIDFSDTDCSSVVSNAINSMITSSTGAYRYLGILHFTKGIFDFPTQINPQVPGGVEACYGLIIEGEGRYTTNLRGLGAHPVFNFTGTDRENRFEAITIRSLEISSNATTQVAGNHLLIFVNATFINVYDCYLTNSFDSAIYLEGLETDFIHHNGIYGNNGIGIEINGESEVHISNNNIYGNGVDGIRASAVSYITIENNFVVGNGLYGIYFYATRKSTISNNQIGVNARDGIIITDSSDNNTICNNVIFENSNGTDNTYSGLRIGDSSFNVISGNRIFDEDVAPNQQWGIKEEGTSNSNLIIACSTLNGGATGGIKIVGPNTQCHSSYNLTSWVT